MTTVSFRQLHQGPRPLLLPNAWDVPSALAFVAAGHRSPPYRAAIHAAVTAAGAVRDGRPPPTATPYPELQTRLEAYQDSVDPRLPEDEAWG
jgi:2-methylisocitrate lyase-like PEP mutase family enzyme